MTKKSDRKPWAEELTQDQEATVAEIIARTGIDRIVVLAVLATRHDIYIESVDRAFS